MDQTFDPLTLLIFGVAIFLVFRLRSVLGTRTGNEKRFDPLPPKDAAVPGTVRNDDGVVMFPGRRPAAGQPQSADEDAPAPEPVWKGFAEEGSPVARGLEAIARSDATFTPKSFLDGARVAYEMIVSAFAEGDKKALKPLLARDVYDGFASAIDARQKAGQTLELRFVGLNSANIVNAELSGTKASVTVKFASDQITATKASDGSVVDGDPSRVHEVTDVWTFERDTTSRDPNWKLAATEAVA
ncbi:MAG: Tim44/TimA family putative adaptor protein [Hyphomicrobiales bacterium]